MSFKQTAIIAFIFFAVCLSFPLYAINKDEGIILFQEAPEPIPIVEEKTFNNATLPVEITASPSKVIATNTEEQLWEGLIESPAASTSRQITDPFSLSFSVLSSLAFVIMLAFGLSYFLQKRGIIRRNAFGKVLSILPLDTKRLIYIAEIAGKYYILGVTEHSINKIDEISNTDMIKLLKLSDKKPENPNITFAKILEETTGSKISNISEKQSQKVSEENKETKEQTNSKVNSSHLDALKALISRK